MDKQTAVMIFNAALSERQASEKTSHLLHFLMCIITGGLWLIVWVLAALVTANQRYYTRMYADVMRRSFMRQNNDNLPRSEHTLLVRALGHFGMGL